MLSYELDFNSCAIRDGFCKSSHKCFTRNRQPESIMLAGIQKHLAIMSA